MISQGVVSLSRVFVSPDLLKSEHLHNTNPGHFHCVPLTGAKLQRRVEPKEHVLPLCQIMLIEFQLFKRWNRSSILDSSDHLNTIN